MEIGIVAGLGNPGREYEGTRHNLGFSFVEQCAAECGAGWRKEDGLLVAEVKVAGRNVRLLKPQKFMNRSGEPLVAFMKYFGLGAEALAVAHDELDIPLGTMRVKCGGGDGGHNGVKSISAALSNSEYVRVRLGIGRPTIAQMAVDEWVLGRFSKPEKEVIAGLIEKSSAVLEALVGESLASVQRRFNS